MDWALLALLGLIEMILVLWGLALRRETRDLRRSLENRRSEESLSADDLRELQRSLSMLVENLENYTEQSLEQMRLHVDNVKRLSQAGETEPPQQKRALRIHADASQIEHRDKERIIALHRQGKSVPEISRELQLTTGEVELVIKLTQ